MEEDGNENLNKIKVFSSDDEKLKILGELLSNKSSRDIIKLLIEKEMYINEIAKKLELRPNLVIHHLQKIESAGLVEITKKKISRKGDDHKFFRMIPNFFISLGSNDTHASEKKSKKLFRKGIKFLSIGFAMISTWFSVRLLQNQVILQDEYEDWGPRSDIDWFLVENELWLPVLSVSIIFLVLYFLIIKKEIKDLLILNYHLCYSKEQLVGLTVLQPLVIHDRFHQRVL